MQPLNKQNIVLTAILFTACALLFPQASYASIEVNCDSQFVKPHATLLRLDIFATGTDDTENIQCALDAAVEQGIPVVKLAVGDFSISTILVTNFKGSFQGTTRADTKLTILDNSINCSAFVANGRRRAAIKFVAGEPVLKFMSIISNHPCIDETIILDAIVHFTGVAWQFSNCKNDVIFAAVDRVDFTGPGYKISPWNLTSAIEASAEGWEKSNSCTKTLLGTFKFNQSSATAFDIGVLTSMRAAAQVDINFNTFTNNNIGIYLIDSNQSTTITGNSFNSVNDDVDTQNLLAIKIKAFDNTAPKKTRVVINNNQINFTDLLEGEGLTRGRGQIMQVGDYHNSLQDISLSITNNHFQVIGYGISLISLNNISNSAITGNTFAGHVDTAILATGSQAVAEMTSDCLIVANSFDDLMTISQDIYLSPKTTGCIVGSGQAMDVVDSGSDNTIL
ncbi:MAG: hypothetical protein IMF09_03180 [Proteobacteria bacterium]|nr:hypothetical protein [Pseudomonadota bacterium]